MTHGQKYQRLRETAIIAIHSHAGLTDAAKAVGISERCLRKWLVRQDFAEAVSQFRRQMLEAGASRIAGLVGKAIQTLENELSAEKASDRIRAARAVLEFQDRMNRDDLRQKAESVSRNAAETQPKAPSVMVQANLFGGLDIDTIRRFLETHRELRARQEAAESDHRPVGAANMRP